MRYQIWSRTLVVVTWETEELHTRSTRSSVECGQGDVVHVACRCCCRGEHVSGVQLLEDMKAYVLDTNETVSIEQLNKIGVLYFDMPPDSPAEKIDEFAAERGYKNRDEIICSPEKLPNFEEKLKTFFEEYAITVTTTTTMMMMMLKLMLMLMLIYDDYDDDNDVDDGGGGELVLMTVPGICMRTRRFVGF